MTPQAILDRLSQGWRGPALAALVALVAGLPGAIFLPPLDRDEARFAQATAQMLETGDFTVIRFQDEDRFKKPVGIYWLQAAAVRLTSEPEARQILPYRLPSLAGAMLAAAACAWGAAAFFGARGGFLAGVMFAASLMLSSQAFIAKTDAVLAGAVTLAMAALARIYADARAGREGGRLTRLLFWLGLSGAILVKGPVGPMVVALASLVLWAWDRDAKFLRRLGWGWGLIILFGVVGPWALAVTVATDGAFWTTAIGGDLAPKLLGGQESHGAPPGYHTGFMPLLTFPAVLLIPAGLVLAWRQGAEPGVRFAIAWLVPAWIVFELTPTKLQHYPLPVYGALFWLAAAAVSKPLPRAALWTGIGLAGFTAAVISALVIYLLVQYGDAADVAWGVLASLLVASATLAGAVLLLRGRVEVAVIAAAGLAILGQAVFTSALLPGLQPLMVSERTVEALREAGLHPRQGLLASPVAVAGYSEPSLVFALGTETLLGDGALAARAVAAGRPAIVEGRQEAAFRRTLAAEREPVRPVGKVTGLNYSNGDEVTLTIYAPEPRRSPEG
jgi:4-amino-4-deoxy-L-arabinose transferase-like glycosyltransferase